MKGNEYVVHLLPISEYQHLERFAPRKPGVQKKFKTADSAIRWVGRVCKKQRRNPWECVQLLKVTGRTCTVETLMFIALQK